MAIARALAHDPPLIIADEPTAHLDYIQVEGVLRLIRSLAAPGRLVVVATHDERITHLADAVVELTRAARRHDGRRTGHRQPGGGRVAVHPGRCRATWCTCWSRARIELYRELANGGTEFIVRVDPGGYFGELGPMLNLPRSASARATEPSVLTGYGLAQFRTWLAGRGAPAIS